MIEFFYQNVGTIFVSIILMIIVVFNINKLCREKNTCGCSCKECSLNSDCHKY